MLRRLVPMAAVAALMLAGVTGCSAQGTGGGDCTPTLEPGVLSDTVKVESGFGEMPEISVPERADIFSTQRTVVERASDRGEIARENTIVGVNMAFFDASDGKQLYASPGFSDPSTGAEYLLVSKEQANPLSEAVRCAGAGDRLTLALGPEDSAALAMQLGASPDSTLLAVIDVDSAAPLRSEGRVHGLPSGFPAVVTDHTGQPGVVLPPRKAPARTVSASRIVGDGPKVSADDGLIGQVLAVGWDGAVKKNTWESGPVALGTEDQIDQSGNTWRDQLTGKTVGSQVVITEAGENGDAQVVVVDILGVN